MFYIEPYEINFQSSFEQIVFQSFKNPSQDSNV